VVLKSLNPSSILSTKQSVIKCSKQARQKSSRVEIFDSSKRSPCQFVSSEKLFNVLTASSVEEHCFGIVDWSSFSSRFKYFSYSCCNYDGDDLNYDFDYSPIEVRYNCYYYIAGRSYSMCHPGSTRLLLLLLADFGFWIFFSMTDGALNWSSFSDGIPIPTIGTTSTYERMIGRRLHLGLDATSVCLLRPDLKDTLRSIYT
jgi:hypothetical protein